MEVTPAPARVLQTCIRQRWLLLKHRLFACREESERALGHSVALMSCKATALTSGAPDAALEA